MKKNIKISYQQYANENELSKADKDLLEAAKKATQNAYAPYSKFKVGAAAKLSGGKIVIGSNQENASFPAGICAERVLLSSVVSQHPNEVIEAIAITYAYKKDKSNHPIAPCGICRQSFQEYKQRTGKAIRLILAGMQGPVIILNDATDLMPFAFTTDELK